VQLAHWKGAHVFATASARHADRLKDLGANDVIDYTTTRFEDVAKDVDFVLDTQGGDIRERSWKTLQPGGVLVAISDPIKETPAKRADVKSVFFIVKPSREQLIEIGALVDIGKLRPFIETVYPLSEAKAAFERSQSGHLSGKIVLRVVG
jgi:NADPH:quinone reductase-like Zn-dependent oxidoreductase